MSRANLGVSEQSEFTEFAANVNFLSLRNLASNELFFINNFNNFTDIFSYIKLN
ncbi:hypothetical protein OCK72_05735 [Fusobacterium simiae]|uniref:Riboflavin synthase subunit alpha n=1 Tax=Fusobacterium simiae TaxID=855 RepID=A0ABT4DHT1_FUSSI|nr:hypothetical protein [Fusobacterium simiae]MCY7008159.1 hypothetical protein [Fusobacterium simiae]